VILLAGVALAFVAGVVFDNGAGAILHLALAVSFMLIGSATFDFRTPGWTAWTAGAGIGVLGAIFLLQGVSDLTQSAALANFAYGILGASLEKVLGYIFLAWCAAVLLTDSAGPSRLFGTAALAVGLGVEAYSYAAPYLGAAAPDALKLMYLSVFVWLLLESRKPA
jgi:hypothetical protein